MTTRVRTYAGTMRRLAEIFWRCTFDDNRRAWRDCYRVQGGIVDYEWGRVLLVLWADWALIAGFAPWPRVAVRRMRDES